MRRRAFHGGHGLVPRRGRDRLVLRHLRALANPRRRRRRSTCEFAAPTMADRDADVHVAAEQPLQRLCRRDPRPRRPRRSATTVTSTNAVPIVVERAMYWPAGSSTTTKGTCPRRRRSRGRPGSSPQGEVGGAQGAETFVLIANTAAAPVNVTVYPLAENTLHLSPGPGSARQLTIPANSRVTVPLSSLVPAGSRSAVEVVETGQYPPGRWSWKARSTGALAAPCGRLARRSRQRACAIYALPLPFRGRAATALYC